MLEKWKSLEKLDKILLCLAAYLAAFVLAMTATFWVMGCTPDVLIQCVLGSGIAEAGFTLLLKLFKRKRKEALPDDDENPGGVI